MVNNTMPNAEEHRQHGADGGILGQAALRRDDPFDNEKVRSPAVTADPDEQAQTRLRPSPPSENHCHDERKTRPRGVSHARRRRSDKRTLAQERGRLPDCARRKAEQQLRLQPTPAPRCNPPLRNRASMKGIHDLSMGRSSSPPLIAASGLGCLPAKPDRFNCSMCAAASCPP